MRTQGLTPREAGILEVLWRQGDTRVLDLQKALPDPLAGSTIRTLLQIMAGKGYVKCRKEGRVNVYRAVIQQQQVQRSALRWMIDRLFGGSAALLLAQIVEDGHVGTEELDRLGREMAGRVGDQACWS